MKEKKKKKKIIILTSIITFLLIVIGLSYAFLTYSKTGSNQQLVLGDIYMHYNENNQLILTDNDITDANIRNFKTLNLYKVNPIMKTQEVIMNPTTNFTTETQVVKPMTNSIVASQVATEENELSLCINYLSTLGYEDSLDSGSTMATYCQGTGTAYGGFTFQDDISDGEFNENQLQEMLSKNIVIEEKIEYTKFEVNSVMSSQNTNELSKCVSYFNEIGIADALDGGSTPITFCQGSGTIEKGVTFQNLIEAQAPDEIIQKMLSLNIIIQNGESYTVNPVMQTQTIGENELSKCVVVASDMGMPLDEGSDYITFCQGTGTSDGLTFQEILDKNKNNENFLSVTKQFLSDNVIVPVIEETPSFEFTISGKNTYSKEDIYYDIILNHGDAHATRTERIKDNLLRFSLVKVVDGKEIVVFENRMYNDLNNRSILTETIPKNTMNELNITYRLYIGFYEEIKVGAVGPNSDQVVDYDFDTWNNQVFASIKVNVKGDLVKR